MVLTYISLFRTTMLQHIRDEHSNIKIGHAVERSENAYIPVNMTIISTLYIVNNIFFTTRLNKIQSYLPIHIRLQILVFQSCRNHVYIYFTEH